MFIVCVLVCSFGHAGETRIKHRQIKQTEFGTGVKTGTTIIQYRETCVWVQVFLISGEFFKEFKEKDILAGPQFSKGGVPVGTFPDRIILDVEATVYKCRPKPNEIIAPDYAAGLMTDASFEASWKEGAETRSIPLLFSEERHRPGLRWDYFLGIPAKGIPLTENLLIDVSLRKGISRTSLSAGLVSLPQ